MLRHSIYIYIYMHMSSICLSVCLFVTPFVCMLSEYAVLFELQHYKL